MDSRSLTDLIDELLAETPAGGRAARTVHGGREHALRQTLMVLREGAELGEHDSPGEATLQVLRGSVRLSAGADSWVGSAGDHVTIPSARHSLASLEDSAVLLSVVVSA